MKPARPHNQPSTRMLFPCRLPRRTVSLCVHANAAYMFRVTVPCRNVGRRCRLTLQRREATVEDQLEIAKLPLGEDDGGEALGLVGELLAAGSIAGDKVLEETACTDPTISRRRAWWKQAGRRLPWGGLAIVCGTGVFSWREEKKNGLRQGREEGRLLLFCCEKERRVATRET